MSWKSGFIVLAAPWVGAWVIYLTARDMHSANGELAALICGMILQGLAGLMIAAFEILAKLEAIREVLEKQPPEKISN